ncbi:hypothetical protein DFS34DRAFT_652638 [Phlyctochytrium arcticum]|nr:hypothetical protein DFS34DRAFT_652638 [Phlyctochytrium arcticum]
MDAVKNMLNKTTSAGGAQQQQQQQQPGGGGGIMNKVNSAMGGGAAGERNEDGLDKAVDFAQEKFMGAGAQNNESAFEQRKDEAISDSIRSGYKSATGKNFPIADK